MKMLIAAAFSFVWVAASAQSKTESFKVYGNCGMCKSRIEKAAKSAGATDASWSADTKMLTVTYDSSKVLNEELQKKIASVGHDTETMRADDSVYSKLPGCCLYERKKPETTEAKKQKP